MFAQQIAQEIGVDACAIYLYSAVRHRLFIADAYGYENDIVLHVSQPPDEHLIGQVWQRGKFVSQFWMHERLDLPPHERPFRSFLGIPLIREPVQKIGVVVLQTSDAKPFPTKQVIYAKERVAAWAEALSLDECTDLEHAYVNA